MKLLFAAFFLCTSYAIQAQTIVKNYKDVPRNKTTYGQIIGDTTFYYTDDKKYCLIHTTTETYTPLEETLPVCTKVKAKKYIIEAVREIPEKVYEPLERDPNYVSKPEEPYKVSGDTLFYRNYLCRGHYGADRIVILKKQIPMESIAERKEMIALEPIQRVPVQSVKIYPIPNNGVFNIESSLPSGKYDVQLLDIQGQIVQQQQVQLENKQAFQFSTHEQIPTGVYIVRIVQGSIQKSTQISIVR